jgi:hypothetical protein
MMASTAIQSPGCDKSKQAVSPTTSTRFRRLPRQCGSGAFVNQPVAREIEEAAEAVIQERAVLLFKVCRPTRPVAFIVGAIRAGLASAHARRPDTVGRNRAAAFEVR